MEMFMQNEMKEEQNVEKEVKKVEETELKAGMYEAIKALPIYDKAEKGRKQKRIGELSSSFKANKGRSTPMALASYDKGDKFSVVEVQTVGTETYGKTPSGHVCLADKKGRNCKTL